MTVSVTNLPRLKPFQVFINSEEWEEVEDMLGIEHIYYPMQYCRPYMNPVGIPALLVEAPIESQQFSNMLGKDADAVGKSTEWLVAYLGPQNPDAYAPYEPEIQDYAANWYDVVLENPVDEDTRFIWALIVGRPEGFFAYLCESMNEGRPREHMEEACREYWRRFGQGQGDLQMEWQTFA